MKNQSLYSIMTLRTELHFQFSQNSIQEVFSMTIFEKSKPTFQSNEQTENSLEIQKPIRNHKTPEITLREWRNWYSASRAEIPAPIDAVCTGEAQIFEWKSDRRQWPRVDGEKMNRAGHDFGPVFNHPRVSRSIELSINLENNHRDVETHREKNCKLLLSFNEITFF